MSANKPPSRRWRLRHSSQWMDSYELPCAVSDRVAVAYNGGRSKSWGIYGYPAQRGQAIEVGEEQDFKAAKVAARKALDRIAANIEKGIFPDIPPPKTDE